MIGSAKMLLSCNFRLFWVTPSACNHKHEDKKDLPAERSERVTKDRQSAGSLRQVVCKDRSLLEGTMKSTWMHETKMSLLQQYDRAKSKLWRCKNEVNKYDWLWK